MCFKYFEIRNAAEVEAKDKEIVELRNALEQIEQQLDYGQINTALYIARRALEGGKAVTEAMELARAVLAQSITAGHNVPGPTPEDIEQAFWALDAALNAAMEAGRHD